ncbi:IS481 family transposase [Candidatus Saccharibacteria bacterium]|nr:IS481 family transposase [Candidatus Saccharibacteria bacterium]
MSYCKGKSIEKQRGEAIKEVILGQRTVAQVARRYGRARSTIYRWLKKWQAQNSHIDFINHNRPNRKVGLISHTSGAKWNIPTFSSCPHTSPKSLDKDIVSKIISTKLEIRRSNYIVWLTLQNEGVCISFSSIRRVVARYHLQRVRLYGKKYWKKDNPKRPVPEHPGDLVEVDTVYLTNNFGGKDLFITNVIDVYSRATYSTVDYSYGQLSTAKAVLKAQEYMGIKFKLVQCDNGREFGGYFKQLIEKQGIAVRHTRVRKPNDNAHIERFNRTMRDELIGPYTGKCLHDVDKNIKDYLIYYNYVRIHTTLGMTPMQMLQSF